MLMMASIRDLLRFRELLYMLCLRDLRVRYKQTVMGFLWALVMPLLVVLAGLVVRLLIDRGSPVDTVVVASLVVKSLPWTLFSSGLKAATNSLIGNTNLVSKVAFPKEVFPFAAIGSSLVDFVAACAVAVLILPWLVPVASPWLLLVPVLLLVLVMMIAGLGLMLSALNLFFRDIKYIVEVALTFAIFFTPVIYDVSMLGRYSNIAMLNPVAPVLEGLQAVVVDAVAPNWGWLAWSVGFAATILALGYKAFKSLEYKFAESI